MKKFKQLLENILSLQEYKRGFKSQAAARDVVRSRTFRRQKEGERGTDATDYRGQSHWVAERPDMPGSGQPDTALLAHNREVARGEGKKVSAAKREELAAQGAAKGKERAARIATQSKQMARTQKTAKTIGIPDIHSILDGSQGQKDVAGVTVVGHEKNGYIAKHQGSIHFKHPDGKTHANVKLEPSPNGIAIWSARAGNKKSVKPIAHIHPEKDAVAVRGGVSKGNVFVDAEDDLNR